jgi:F0F1-type ATP synthase delta subunit
MAYTAQQYAAALFHALRDVASKDTNKVLDNFARILREESDIALYSQIEKEYQAYEQSMQAIAIQTARKLPQQEIARIVDELQGILRDTHARTIRQSIDEDLVGGIAVQADDLLLDGSLRKKLQELKHTLAQGE